MLAGTEKTKLPKKVNTLFHLLKKTDQAMISLGYASEGEKDDYGGNLPHCPKNKARFIRFFADAIFKAHF